MSFSVPLRGFPARSHRLTAAVLSLVVGLMATLLAGVFVPLPAGAATGADLDQCANGPLAAPVSCTLDSQWDNGNLNASKAHYAEGDSVPYRLTMTGLTAGETYTTTVEWDTTKGGMHALDYITTFDRTVTGADPCAGVTGCGGVPTTFPIPADPNLPVGVPQILGNFTLFGGTISGVSPYTLTGTYAGDSSTRITVSYVAAAETTVLAWAGHISTRLDWGTANSAVAIPGSPYHTRLIEFDGKGGNQDRSLSAAAVIFPASITIIKDAIPNDTQDFDFTATGGLTPAGFVLDDDPNSATPNTQTFSDITTLTTYTVTEAAAAGWSLSFGTPVCTVTSPNGGTQAAAASTVTIDLEEGENVTCTFTNTRQTGTLRVDKVVVGDAGDDRFDLQIDGTTAGTGANVGHLGTTGTIAVGTGDHTVGEIAAAGTDLAGYTTAIDCTGGEAAANGGPLTVNVGNSEAVVCTITNTRQTGTLRVDKVVVGDVGDDRFNLQIDGATAGTGGNVGNGGTTGAVPVNTGVHTVRETAVAGTDLADYVTDIDCSDGSVLSGSAGPLGVTVANNVDVTCTITNTRKTGTIRVTKIVQPANDPGRFNLRIDGVTVGTGGNVGNGGTTGTITLPTGVHTVDETAGTNTSLADYTTTIVCGNGPAVPGTSTTVTLASDQAVSCTITNVRRPAEDPCRQAASRTNNPCPGGDDDDEPCRGAAGRTGNPCDDDDDDRTEVDDLVVVQPPAPNPPADPVTDPAAGVAGNTNQGGPVPEHVLPAQTTRPEPAPGSGFLPRTGAGLIGQATLALALIGAGLILRLARRRRSADSRA